MRFRTVHYGVQYQGVKRFPSDAHPPEQGEMARRVGGFDWTTTPLGPMPSWPQSLRTAVQMTLASPFPNIVLWGPDLIQIYNDGYRDLMGNKHPAGLGQPTRQCWPEVWRINEPIYRRVLSGESFSFEDALYPITRSGILEDAWFTLSCSPIRDEDESVAGVLVTVFETTAHHKASRAVDASEEKYRTLFNSLDEAVCTINVLFDADGNAVDYRFLEKNPIVESIAGFTFQVGQTIRELMPDIDNHWIETVASVARTGVPVRVEYPVKILDKWISAYLSRVGGAGSSKIVCVYNDITDRKRREENLAFLAEVSQDLARLANIDETMMALGVKIGEHFDVARVIFAEISEDQETGHVSHEWHKADLPDMRGSYAAKEYFSPEFERLHRAGEIAVVRNVERDGRVDAERYAALGVGAFVGVPLVRQNKWRFYFSLLDSKPHDWRDDETDLLHEITMRIWTRLEHARAEEALRQSEQRLQKMVNVPSLGVLTFDFAGRMLHANDAFLEMVGYSRADFAAKTHTWRDFTPAEYGEASEGILEQIRQTSRGGPYEKEYFRRDGSRVWLMFVAANLGDGTIVEYAVDVSDRKQVEKALRQSEEKYRTLFDSIDEGFTVMQILRDEAGQPFDLRYLEANRVFERQTGLSDVIGKTVRQVIPNLEPYWLETLAQVARTGEPARFENYVAGTDRWFNIFASRNDGPDSWQVAVVFDDITERKNEEQRRDFLLKLSDALRPLTDPIVIQDAAMQVLGAHLGVSRAFYSEVLDDENTIAIRPGYANGVSSLAGRMRFSDFDSDMMDTYRAGRTVVLNDIDADRQFTEKAKAGFKAIQTQAAVGVPLVKNGKVRAILSLHHSLPRKWTEPEIALLEETAERMWAAVERARIEAALRASEARLQKAIAIETVGVIFFRLDGPVTDVNETIVRMSGYRRDELLRMENWETLAAPEFRAATSHSTAQLTDKGASSPYEAQWVRRDGTRWWGLVASTQLSDAGAASLCVEFIIDISEQKVAEEAVRAALDAVALANEELETRVQERTRELTETLDKLARSNTVRRELLHQLVDAQEKERGYIARELHDNTGQLITALSLGLNNLSGVLPTPLPNAATAMLERMRAVAYELGAEAHRLSTSLRPTTLDLLGLVAALKNYVEQWSSWSGLTVDYQTLGFREGGGERLPREIETTAYRIVQEALTNILRYASPNRTVRRDAKTARRKKAKSASRVSVFLQRTDDLLMAVVEDDGPGFDVEEVLNRPPDRRRLGLFGMKERADLVGGTLEIESQPGSGTSIFFRAPLQPLEDAPPSTDEL